LKPCPQFHAPFVNVSTHRLSYLREELTNRNPENILTRECGLKRRQPMSLFISGHLSAVLTTEQKTNLVLGEAGLLAIAS
jgi:hypothetical protein